MNNKEYSFMRGRGYDIKHNGELRYRKLAYCTVCGKDFLPDREHRSICPECKKEIKKVQAKVDDMNTLESIDFTDKIEYS